MQQRDLQNALAREETARLKVVELQTKQVDESAQEAHQQALKKAQEAHTAAEQKLKNLMAKNNEAAQAVEKARLEKTKAKEKQVAQEEAIKKAAAEKTAKIAEKQAAAEKAAKAAKIKPAKTKPVKLRRTESEVFGTSQETQPPHGRQSSFSSINIGQ